MYLLLNTPLSGECLFSAREFSEWRDSLEWCEKRVVVRCVVLGRRGSLSPEHAEVETADNKCPELLVLRLASSL